MSSFSARGDRVRHTSCRSSSSALSTSSGPHVSLEEPTLMVVAASNAQAKNISTAEVKARTLHNASGMRVQKLINPLMCHGKEQAQLTRLWGQVRVLVVEE